MDRPEQPIHVLSLCSGGGGLDRGVELAIPGARTICYVEREGFAVAYLVAAMEAGSLRPAPCFTNLRSFDGRPWRGIVDIITAGYPCQPFSYAGKRIGADDPRHLWPHVARIIGEVEPGLVFLENVPGHVSLGFPEVLEELRSLGYQATAGLYSAEEVGSSQKRERLFILGQLDDAHRESRGPVAQQQQARAADDHGPGGRDVAHPESTGGRQHAAGPGTANPQARPKVKKRRAAPQAGRTEPTDPIVADAELVGREGSGPAEGPASGMRRRPAEPGGELADAQRAMWGPDAQAGIHVGDRPDPGGREADGSPGGTGRDVDGAMGHPERPREDAHGEGGRSRGSTGEPGGVVGDPDLTRPQGRGLQGRERGDELAARSSGPTVGPDDRGIPLFPPGPGVLVALGRIHEIRPELAPAQPKISFLVDGMAPDRSRWLRLLGNGVCILKLAACVLHSWILSRNPGRK